MKVKVLSLKGTEFVGEAVSFNVKTTSGEITVLDRHLPLVTVLSKGRACVTKANNDKVFLDINSGFLEMNRQNELRALIN